MGWVLFGVCFFFYIHNGVQLPLPNSRTLPSPQKRGPVLSMSPSLLSFSSDQFSQYSSEQGLTCLLRHNNLLKRLLEMLWACPHTWNSRRGLPHTEHLPSASIQVLSRVALAPKHRDAAVIYSSFPAVACVHFLFICSFLFICIYTQPSPPFW